MPRYDTPGPIEVEIDLGVGHVEVVASDRVDAGAEVSPTKPGRSGDVSLAREATVSFEGGRLRVLVPRRLNLFGRSDSVDVRVEVPIGSRVAIDTAYGAVHCRGVLGASRIVAKYGNVRADTVGDLVLESPHGMIDVAEVTGRFDATVGHGHVRVGRVGGDARIRGSHGVIELGTTVGAVEIATSGPVTIDRALGDVTARSAHGAIRIGEVTRGSVRLENGYAEIEVGVPHGVAAWLDAASAN
ncbi:MAG: hypothetical protein JWP95_852, partial [Actinotalea sp.]|nr:hypothetical protein [Actinotalea sp.]